MAGMDPLDTVLARTNKGGGRWESQRRMFRKSWKSSWAT